MKRWTLPLLAFAIAMTLCSHHAFAQENQGSKTGGGKAAEPGGCEGGSAPPKPSPPAPATDAQKAVMDELVSQTGSQSQAECYNKLFKQETGDNPSCYQPVTTNSPGVGVCTIDGQAALRKSHGPDCDVPNESLFNSDHTYTTPQLIQQVKCCIYMAKNTPGYFAKSPNYKLPCN